MRRHVWIAGGLFTMMLTLGAALTGMARPKGDTWEIRETPMLSQRVGFATSTVNGKIFVVGGTVWNERVRRGKVLRTVEEYDPATNRWKFRTDMRIGRNNLASSAVNGRIYAIGGSVQMLWTRKHVEEFDPATDTWEKKADMLEPRSNFSSNVVDGKIYAIGGNKRWNPDRYVRTVEVYDPATNTWEKRADMPTARCCLSVNTVNGIIYAISGGNESGIPENGRSL